MWGTVIAFLVVYIIGFFLGRKYEKDSVVDGVIGVLAEIDKHSQAVESVTYYYSEDAYQNKVKELKETGADYYEE